MVTRHSLNSHFNKGFSLLELIIVLVIIGVLVAAISISIADTRGDNLRLEARRLAARIALARDEAIITNQEYGLEIKHNGYQFLLLKDDKWQVIGSGDEKQLVKQKLPEDMEIQLEVDGLFSLFQQQGQVSKLFREYQDDDNDSETEPDAEELIRPQIYLMSSGELNPFNLFIGYDDQEPVFYQLKVTFDGKVTLEGPVRDSMAFALGAEQ